MTPEEIIKQRNLKPEMVKEIVSEKMPQWTAEDRFAKHFNVPLRVAIVLVCDAVAEGVIGRELGSVFPEGAVMDKYIELPKLHLWMGEGEERKRETLPARLYLGSMDSNALCVKVLLGKGKPDVSFVLEKDDLLELRHALDAVIR